MQHVSIPLKPVGKPPPYPPPRPTRSWSSLAAYTAYNEAYPLDLCAAVVWARMECENAKKKEMEKKYEREKKYAWRTQHEARKWKRNKLWCQARRRWFQTWLVRRWFRAWLAAVVPSPAAGPSTTYTAAFLPPQLQHLSDDEQKVCRDSTSTNDDPEWLLAELFDATNAPR